MPPSSMPSSLTSCRMLFFATLHSTPGRVWWQGVSMAKAGQAEQRVERILAWKGTVTMKTGRSLAVLIAALAVPVIYLAASVRPLNTNAGMQAAQPAPPADPVLRPTNPELQSTPTVHDPAKAPELRPPMAGPAGGVIAGHNYSLIRPVTPLAPHAMMPPPTAVLAGRRSIRFGSGGFDDEQRFVIVSANSDDFTMSGSGSDARHAIKLKKQITGDFIWF